MIVLCTSCKPVIRLSILAEKEPVKNLEGMHGEEKNMELGSDRIEAFPLIVIAQPTPLTIFFPFTPPMSLVPAYQAIHLFNIHYLSKITVKMHIHRCITIIFNSFNHNYVLKTPLRYKDLANLNFDH